MFRNSEDTSPGAAQPMIGLRVAITGGTSGLGLALVEELLHRGAEVAFVARHQDRVERVVRDLALRMPEGRQAKPGSDPELGSLRRSVAADPHGIVADVSHKEDIYPLAMQIVGELGGLDVLVNNASDLGPTPLKLLADTECEELERALATNVLGPFRLTRALLGALAASARTRGAALVLNISSDAATTAYPYWGAYGASKAALRHMSLIWDAELTEQGIRFLSIDPGDMDTPMHALAVPDADPATLKRPETAAREVADAIARALSPATAPVIAKQAS